VIGKNLLYRYDLEHFLFGNALGHNDTGGGKISEPVCRTRPPKKGGAKNQRRQTANIVVRLLQTAAMGGL